MNHHQEDTTEQRTLEALSHSQVFLEYQRAFTLATGMPLELRPPESPRMSTSSDPCGRFCRWIGEQSEAVTACTRCQYDLIQKARNGATTVTCPFGLWETAVPVRTGRVIIGYLRTGKVMAKPAKENSFRARAARFGIRRDLARGETLHNAIPTVSARKYTAMVNLLGIFAEHLSRVSNEIVLQQENMDPPLVSRAKEYIEQHEADHLSLPDVARAVNTTASYLCRLFKRSTGVNFTEYLQRVRLSRAKSLLLNPQMRVSEVAFAAGFQSLTQFNRTFQRLMGQSPTEFRNELRNN